MRTTLIAGLCLLSTTMLGAEVSPRATAEDFAWLAGCWASVGREFGSGEWWTAPAGGTLLGIARTVKDGKTVAWEYVQIRENEHGGVDYVALPSGQEQAVFGLVSISDREVIFENPQHDFPQRVIYRLPKGGLLVGRIEGELDGRERSADFPMRRIDCAALAPVDE